MDKATKNLITNAWAFDQKNYFGPKNQFGPTRPNPPKWPTQSDKLPPAQTEVQLGGIGPHYIYISQIGWFGPESDRTRPTPSPIYKCEQFFLLDGTSLDTKVWLASIHLDEIALQWHLNYMRTKFDVYPSWSQYVADVAACFGEAYEDPLATLIQVKQTGKIQDYIDEFELALTQVSLNPEHSLSIFLAG